MKKRIITLLLALVFIIPCMFALASCDKPCNHSEATHGLCECGHYAGETLEKANGSQIVFDKIEAGETVYGRIEIDAINHLYYSQGFQLNATNSSVKFYARYLNTISGKITFREINIPWATANEIGYYFDNLPVDNFVYIDFTNESEEEVTSFALAIYPSSHSHSVDFTSTGVIDLDEEFTGGQHYCYKYSATAGKYLIYTKSDFVSFPKIYGANNVSLNESLEKQGGNYYLTLTEGQDLFFHFFCNTIEDSSDSHFTIQKTS